jgi:hypothetical protein
MENSWQVLLGSGSKTEHQKERLNTHKTENTNHTIDTMIYVET